MAAIKSFITSRVLPKFKTTYLTPAKPAQFSCGLIIAKNTALWNTSVFCVTKTALDIPTVRTVSEDSTQPETGDVVKSKMVREDEEEDIAGPDKLRCKNDSWAFLIPFKK